MTIKDYLKEFLTKYDNIPGTPIEVWEMAVQGKGKIVVEYNTETLKADIVHETRDRRSDFYQAVNATELKDTVEFCLGPVVSDIQWNASRTAIDDTIDDFDDDVF